MACSRRLAPPARCRWLGVGRGRRWSEMPVTACCTKPKRPPAMSGAYGLIVAGPLLSEAGKEIRVGWFRVHAAVEALRLGRERARALLRLGSDRGRRAPRTVSADNCS